MALYRSDLNCDGEVDGADLGILLGDFDPSGVDYTTIPAPCACGGGQQQSAQGESSGMSVEEAINFVGFQDFDELAEWSQSATQDETDAVTIMMATLIQG